MPEQLQASATRPGRRCLAPGLWRRPNRPRTLSWRSKLLPLCCTSQTSTAEQFYGDDWQVNELW